VIPDEASQRVDPSRIGASCAWSAMFSPRDATDAAPVSRAHAIPVSHTISNQTYPKYYTPSSRHAGIRSIGADESPISRGARIRHVSDQRTAVA
jgi:hypothetical protein